MSFKYLLVFLGVLSLIVITNAQMSEAAVFYPFGSAAGDTVNIAVEDENSTLIDLWSPFVFFGRTYNKLYVNNNGHLTFNQPSAQYLMSYFPIDGNEDIIAPLLTDIDVSEGGIISYQQYTSGEVLTYATLDINQYFPALNLTADWVLVVTWDRVEYFYHSGTESSFQVVLISAGESSFLLMNYGNCAATNNLIQAGYDTINSANYFLIPESNNGNLVQHLMNSSNVNVPGRWAFRVEGGTAPNHLHESVVGIQIRLSSFSDLSQVGNIEIFLEKLKQELVKNGLPDSLKLNLRRLENTQP